MTIELVNV